MRQESFIFFLNTYGAFLLFLGTCFYLWFKQKAKKEISHVIWSAILTLAVVYFLKILFNVPRPYLFNGTTPAAGFFSGNHSFPSFHAALSFTLATAVILHQKKTGIILFLLAVLIAFGRVVASVHYPVDVASGAVVGTLIALFIDRLDS